MRRPWPLAKPSARHGDARHQALTKNPSETQRELGLVSSEQGEVCSTDLLGGQHPRAARATNGTADVWMKRQCVHGAAKVPGERSGTFFRDGLRAGVVELFSNAVFKAPMVPLGLRLLFNPDPDFSEHIGGSPHVVRFNRTVR